MARELPRIEVKPIVWNLNLVPIDDFLLEDTISISQTVAPSGIVERGETVEETRGEATKTTVTKSSIMLLPDNVLDAEAEIFHSI